ncbi:UNVERIFIED_CONTAM: hypothetical protein K2H54_047059, partial [Gekko kuhli]
MSEGHPNSPVTPGLDCQRYCDYDQLLYNKQNFEFALELSPKDQLPEPPIYSPSEEFKLYNELLIHTHSTANFLVADSILGRKDTQNFTLVDRIDCSLDDIVQEIYTSSTLTFKIVCHQYIMATYQLLLWDSIAPYLEMLHEEKHKLVKLLAMFSTKS